MDQNKPASIKWKWLYIISPCVIVAVSLLFEIISSSVDRDHSGGWSMLGVIILLPILFVVIVADLVIRLLVKKQVLYLWLIETAVLLIAFLVYKNYFAD